MDGELDPMVILAFFFCCQLIPYNICFKSFCLTDPFENLMKTIGPLPRKEKSHMDEISIQFMYALEPYCSKGDLYIDQQTQPHMGA